MAKVKKADDERRSSRAVVGWREWAHLPDFDVRWLKTKIDTGARTSSLHAEDIEAFTVDDAPWVRFVVYPKQRVQTVSHTLEAPLLEHRVVRSSNGQEEERPVIETTLQLGADRWPIELTLARREGMGFRMLIGRQGLRGHVVVDPGRSFVQGRRKKKKPA
ncbi:MAG: ATP-dependent zinc protease [Myxococcota bacterium]